MVTSIIKSRGNVKYTYNKKVNFEKYPYILLFLAGKSSYAGMKTGKPEFVGTIPNQSVAIGRDAVFTCNVKSLGPYKVSAR